MKVAGYARVSKETDRLLNSVSAQINNYTKLIKSNPEWEFAGIYSDIGISGLGIKSREGINRLINDCEEGKIDIILTKSISRFARNTLDLLAIVRRLKDIGVEVRFERENINSLSSDGELMLTILGSFAQEESFSISNNVKWAIRKKYEKGDIGIRNKSVFGYRFKDKQYIIEENEALYVREIFEKYYNGSSISLIVRYLKENKVKTVRGFDFSANQVKYILKNEIYIGNLLLQKVFIENPIKKNVVKNYGQLPKYYIENCHEAIISSELFYLVQEAIEQRQRSVKNDYCFSRKIKCGICGRYYTRREYAVNTSWYCGSKNTKNGCDSIILQEENLQKITASMLENSEFNEIAFLREVDNITVLENGQLKFNFNATDFSSKRRSKIWQGL